MEAKERIEKAAWKLFYEIGYSEASYSAIATESENGRPLVQYHFPKKEELLVSFILAAMNGIATEMNKKISSADDIEYTLHFGQIYYSLLLGSDNMKSLAEAILSNRIVTSRVIRANAENTIPRLAGTEGSETAIQASIMATGAVYDLVFEKLQSGEDMDPGQLSAQNVALFFSIYKDMPYSETVRSLEGKLLEEKLVAEIANKVIKTLCK